MKRKRLLAFVALVLLVASCGPSAALSAPTGVTVEPTTAVEPAPAESTGTAEQRGDLSDNPADPQTDLDGRFEPINVPEYGIEAVVPVGWLKMLDEYYIAPDQSVELVIKENQMEGLEAVLTFWGASVAIAEIEANGLTWTLRPIWRKQDNVAGYIATCPSEKGFYMVLVVTPTREQQSRLYNMILVPVVESFTIGLPGD
jgi:hypothetical protein